jgi:hypothetical protein
MHPKLANLRFEHAIQGLTDELCAMRGWIIHERTPPVLDISFVNPSERSLRLRFLCDRWNALPPSIELLTTDGQPLSDPIQSSTNIFHAGPHPLTGRPFVCMRGSREYHTHDSHLTDAWESLRDSADYRLLEIVTQIWNGWRRNNP